MHASVCLRHARGRGPFVARAAVAILLLFVIDISPAAVFTWTGSGGTSWATSSNWNPTGGPGTSDTASFTNTGSVTFPGTVTSVLDTNHTVGGLVFVNSSGHYDTLDFGGFTLTDNGNLSFNTDENSPTTTTIRDGILNVSGGVNSTISVGSGVSGNAVGTADFSGLTSFGATIQNLYVGENTTTNSATGTLTLSPSNTISASSIIIGSTLNPNASGTSTLTFGNSNSILTGQFTVAQNYSNATATLPAGGNLTLGSTSQLAALSVSNADNNSSNVYTGELDLSQGSFNGYLSSLTVAQQTGPNSSITGTFNAGESGSVLIGASGTNTATIAVANATAGATVHGTVNFGGLSSLAANLNTFAIGTASNSGSTALGTVTLAASNTINANSITVGSSVNPNASGASTLTLGTSNSILTNQLTIAQNYSNATVTLPAGGNLTLGSPSQLTALSVSSATNDSSNSYTGLLDLSQGSFTGYLSSLDIGQGQEAGPEGSVTGTFNAGKSGSVLIGASGTNTANIIVGSNTNNASITGTVNFGGLSSLTANLNTFTIGTAAGSGGTALGTVTLAASNTINATSITVGSSVNPNASGTSTLTFGNSNSILTGQFAVAQNYSNATATLPAGGNLTLGSTSQLAALSVSNADNNSSNVYTGELDLSQGSFNGYLSSLTVAQQTGPNSSITGTFNAGESGSVLIGASGTNTATIAVANATAGATVHGTVNFGGLSSLAANLNTFAIGTASNSGSTALGTVTLAASNTINANSITVGSSVNPNASGASTLTLGTSNSILTNQLTIAQNYSNATVTLPAGGNLTLGSPSQLTALSVSNASITTTNSYTGLLDLSQGSFTGYLSSLTVGQGQNTGSEGGVAGTLTISSNPANYVTANSVTLGGTKTTGTLNYGGGTFYAGSIAAGSGNANFNWTGGTLSVGTFGTPTIPFNLNNTGTGTLAPATASGAIGTNTINGNYTQGSSATTAIRIAGDSAGTGNDQVSISGTASLAGNLDLSLIDGFIPAVGENFLIETYGSHSGSYSYVAPPTLPQNVAFLLDYTTSPTQLMVRMVTPVPQNYVSTASVGSFGTASSWDTDTTPGTANNVTINNTGTTAQTVTVATSTTVQGINLSGSGAPLNLEIPQGISLGVASGIVVGANATVGGGGTVTAFSTANNGLIQHASGAANLGTVSGTGTLQVGAASGSPAIVSASSLSQAAVTINSTGKLQLLQNIPGVTSSIGSLSITGGGQIDITNNGLLLNETNNPLSQVTAWIQSQSITSSLVNGPNSQASRAIGYGDSSEDPLTIPAGDVEVKYVPFGDTNLDGVVDITDLTRAINNLGLSPGYYGGDVANQGMVNITDIADIINDLGATLNADGTSVPAALMQTQDSSVPEPASLGLLTVGALGLLARRRRGAESARSSGRV